MSKELKEYLEQYNKIISNKIKHFGVYELIDLWGKTKDDRFKNLAVEIIKEIYNDLLTATNKEYCKLHNNSLNYGDFYNIHIQHKLKMLRYLLPDHNIKEKYEELWYIMFKLDIK